MNHSVAPRSFRSFTISSRLSGALILLSLIEFTRAQTVPQISNVSELPSTRPEARLTGHRYRVHSLAFSPDGKTLATGAEGDGTRLWDLRTGELKASLPKPKHVGRLSFSPDGLTILTGNAGNTLSLWDVKTGTLKAMLIAKKALVFSVAFSPDSRTVATASIDESIVRLWDVETGALKVSLPHEKDRIEGGVFSVAFSPDGQTLATSTNRKVYLWNTSDWHARMTLVDPRLSRAGSVRVHGRWEDQVETASHAIKIWAVAFSPDGRTLATGSDDGTVKLWDIATEQLTATLEHVWRVFFIAFSSDGKVLASRGGPVVRLWSVASGKLLTTLVHKGTAWSFSFSPNGKLIATGADQEKAVKLWESASGRLIEELTEGRPPVAFSPDGRTLAMGSGSGVVLLRDVVTR